MGVSLHSRGFKRNDDDTEWVEVFTECEDPFNSNLKDWSAVTTGEYNYSKMERIAEQGLPPGFSDKFFNSESFIYGEYCYGWITTKKLNGIDFDKTIVRDIRSVIDWQKKLSDIGFEKTIALAPTTTLREFLGDEFITAIAKWEHAGAQLLVFYSN